MQATRTVLHRVAAHVLGRRRSDVSGRFGLRATPDGFGTPAFGPDPEIVRVSGTWLVREVGGSAKRMSLSGATMQDLATFVDVDLASPFTVGNDGPEVGDAGTPLEINGRDTRRIADWYALGWRVLDEVCGRLGPDAETTTMQLWPEHFDAATTVTASSGEKVNLGFSPGDDFEPEPYAYVGPYSRPFPGEPSFWNAPFGAVLTAIEIDDARDGAAACIEFFEAGLRNAGQT